MNKIIILLILGMWSGLVLGLSFIEAPLKFQAPGITLNLGLGIGRLVFGVLNRVEIGFVAVLIIAHLDFFKKMSIVQISLLAVPILVVIIQSLWLLPVLDHRAELLLSGKKVMPSNNHLYFVVLEIFKLVTLVTLFIKTYKFLNT